MGSFKRMSLSVEEVESPNGNKEKRERGRMTGRCEKLESVQGQGRDSRDEPKALFGGIRQSHTKAGGDKEAATCPAHPSALGIMVGAPAVSG